MGKVGSRDGRWPYHIQEFLIARRQYKSSVGQLMYHFLLSVAWYIEERTDLGLGIAALSMTSAWTPTRLVIVATVTRERERKREQPEKGIRQ